VPAVILEGKWLEKDYGWKIGDQIGVAYYPCEIRLRTKDIGFVLDWGKIKKSNKKLPEGCNETSTISLSQIPSESQYIAGWG